MVEDKKALRRHMRGILASMGDEQRTVASRRIVEQINRLCYLPSVRIYLPIALKQEVDVSGPDRSGTEAADR